MDYTRRRRGRLPGLQLRVAVRIDEKPTPDARQIARMAEARVLLAAAKRGDPVGLHRPGMLRHEAARVLATYGGEEDERLALSFLPWEERKHLLAVRRRRAQDSTGE